MRYFLSVLLFTPLLLRAQQQLQLNKPYHSPYQIKTIRERNGRLTLLPAKTKWLNIGGNYTLSTAANLVNTLPPLQEHDNNMFRTGHTINQSLSVRATIISDSWNPLWVFSLKAGSNAENSVIPDNRNTTHNLSMSVQRNLDKFSIAGSYAYFSSHFSNDNSNGFLNRVYENALLTPSPTDDPWSLLKNNGHFADRQQQTGNLSLQKNQGHFNIGIATTIDAINDKSNQSLKTGTAFLPAGLLYTRSQNDDHYSSNAFLAYNFRSYDDAFLSTARLNYIYNNEKVQVDYPTDIYSWQRSSNDAAFTFNTAYNGYHMRAGINAGNKFYESNTSGKTKFFLPELNGFITSKNLLDNHLTAKLTAGFTSFCSELAINHTLSPFLLTQLTPQESYTFYPTTEVQTFSNLSLMQHQEFTSGVQFELNYRISLQANYSIRNTKDNPFPTYENNELILKNLADTRYKGFDIQLQFNSPHRNFRKFYSSNSISLYKFSNIVTRVQDGYNDHPIAGFSTVYKALVKGQPLGVILNKQLSVIGNPTPDYTLRFSHITTWKAWSFNLDWEYRKGGDCWNGTAAVLDSVYHNHTGKAASYIQKADNIRIHTLSLAYDIKLKKILQLIRLTAYAQNLVLWSAYKGVDPNQLLYDQSGSAGLDFFNLPSTKTYGLSASLQF